MRFTSSPLIALALLSPLVLFAIPAHSAPASAAATFDATFRTYQEMSSDPRGTRDQWLRVVRSFVAIHHKERKSETGKRSLFFAGRASLSLYRRSGNKSDLDQAIRHLNEFVKMHRSGPYLILGLQELKEAHLLKRKLLSCPAQQVSRQSARREKPKSADQKMAGRERSRPSKPREAQRGAGAVANTRHQEAAPCPASTAPVGPAQPEGPEPQANSLWTPSPASTGDVRAPAPSDESAHKPSVGWEFNCTGNPFFQGPREYAPRPVQPLRSASLPPVTINDTPRQLRPEPVETPSVSAPPASKASTAHAEEAKEEAPRESAVDAPTKDQAPAPACDATPEKYVVVIDPGHGGKDPGATSSDGQLKEKDVTLKVAKRIKAYIEKNYPGITVALTRKGDAFLPLQERTAFANSLNADLFVSIHCNAAEDASSRGIETYYLSKASSQKAMASAARENGIPANRMSDIDATLLDLLIDSKKSESVKLAEAVHQSLISTIAGTNSLKRNRGVKRAPFYVLLGAKMPAILVECGFINGRERESLKESSYLDSLATGITDGLGHYLQGLGDKG